VSSPQRTEYAFWPEIDCMKHAATCQSLGMIDPLVSLSFSLYSNRGAYALLIGSGLSRSAGIPTGWEIVQDLIHRLAVLENHESEDDLEAWYRKTHGVEADYSDLLAKLGGTASERRQLLLHYFEPSPDEEKLGLKLPTRAHRAIAKLMKDGYIRVVVTTNFDRLLEIALADVGVQPTVIANSDAVKGALPLSHQKALIIKVNGDYLDSRIRNTVQELQSYEPESSQLLDRIFDEFGLLVCGWSGDWDTALRQSILGCPNRRFSTYWCTKGTPSPKALDLIRARSAVTLPIENADDLFSSVEGKLLAMEHFSDHPLSAKIASAFVKRFIPKDEDMISLHDLVSKERDRAYSQLNSDLFHTRPVPDARIELANRLVAYNNICEVLVSMMITGSFWGKPSQSYLWKGVISRFGKTRSGPGGLIAWDYLRYYPATLLMYGGGLAALAGRQYHNLSVILKASVWEDAYGEPRAAAGYLNQAHVMRDGLGKFLPVQEHALTPLSDYLYETFADALSDFVSPDESYRDLFALFEYMSGVVAWSSGEKTHPGVGRCRWSHPKMFSEDGPTAADQPQIKAMIKPLFGSEESYQNAKKEYDSWVISVTRHWSHSGF
jgi:SIR2-like domain